MLRRRALSLLLTSAARLYSRPLGTLDRFLDAKQGCALLLDVRSGDILASNSKPLVNTILVPPGSTLKPFVLSALLRSGKLRSDESFLCPERLVLAGHRMDCSHPRLATPMRIDTALAYSCNCFVAHFAKRFAPGELARVLEMSGSVTPQRSADLQLLQRPRRFRYSCHACGNGAGLAEPRTPYAANGDSGRTGRRRRGRHRSTRPRALGDWRARREVRAMPKTSSHGSLVSCRVAHRNL